MKTMLGRRPAMVAMAAAARSIGNNSRQRQNQSQAKTTRKGMTDGRRAAQWGKAESGKRKAETPSPACAAEAASARRRPGLAATLSHPMGEGLGVRALLRVGHGPNSRAEAGGSSP